MEKCVVKHLGGHRLLFEARYKNEICIDNATRIQYFEPGIKLETRLEQALTTTRTNKLTQGYFGPLVSFLSTEVERER